MPNSTQIESGWGMENVEFGGIQRLECRAISASAELFVGDERHGLRLDGHDYWDGFGDGFSSDERPSVTDGRTRVAIVAVLTRSCRRALIYLYVVASVQLSTAAIA